VSDQQYIGPDEDSKLLSL